MKTKSTPALVPVVPWEEHWRAVHNFLAAFEGMAELRDALAAAKDAEAAVVAAHAELATLHAGAVAAAQDFGDIEAKITKARATLDGLEAADERERARRSEELGIELAAQRTVALAEREAHLDRLCAMIARQVSALEGLDVDVSRRTAELAKVEADVAEANRELERLTARFVRS